MRAVSATRYVTPLREGGSLPAIVEADDAGLYVAKFRGAAGELCAVRRERQLLEPLSDALSQRADQIENSTTDERLAAGETDPADAAGNEQIRQADDLLDRKDVPLRQELHLLRHAIAAAKIAPIRDR